MNDAALWDRRDETMHPAPVGYWLEDEFTFATPLDDLLGREATLQKREAYLYERGVRCELKWNPRMTCSACPVHEVGQETPLSILCRIGREQERVSAIIVTKQETLKGTI